MQKSLFEGDPEVNFEKENPIQRSLPLDGKKLFGETFTKKEVVRLMFDVSAQYLKKDLDQSKVLEPSFGSGEFLLGATRRCFRASDKHLNDKLTVINNIYGCEIQLQHHNHVINQLEVLLKGFDVDITNEELRQVTSDNIVMDDFLFKEYSKSSI